MHGGELYLPDITVCKTQTFNGGYTSKRKMKKMNATYGRFEYSKQKMIGYQKDKCQ